MREQVLTWLAANVPATRVDHILRVEKMAMELAESHKIDREKAANAALMHDLAKYFSPKRLLQMAKADGLEVDEVLEINPHLLHADVSAIVARKNFSINDKEILQAIANHTLGRPGMSQLCCIVFLADSLEPARGETKELDLLRHISYSNLEQAMWLTCDRTVKYLLERRCTIHPRVITTRNWFLTQSKPKQSITVSSA
jgi:predicted HD superfamily hydrolase involved in NAD metabolism